eukprot:TRINITY_DN11678_c0_g1_i1.p1 TRINITY_DN11678_c0_g1~~TRINITY_DN11678_c0_g1_i1.p1  ORF type:complete len:290 (+),score=32.41 TRINITY_DN11678_c0_g1_i1:38-871(+)
MARHTTLLPLVLVALFLATFSFETVGAIDCSYFDGSQIKLVTFDTFAALTLLPESLANSVAHYLPDLDQAQVNQIVDAWITVYADNLGHSFEVSVTGYYPFQWMVNTSIVEILSNMSISVTNETLSGLEGSWGDLIPRPGANITLQALQAAGLEVGPLSNGDYFTLQRAFTVFAPKVIPNYIFSSDFPVMCFKNCSEIYQHVLDVTGYLPTQYLHVAGSNYDGEGARAAGIFSAVLETEYTSDRNMADAYSPANTPCFFLKSLTDVLPILGVELTSL